MEGDIESRHIKISLVSKYIIIVNKIVLKRNKT